ncbi:hypothetical protein [Candidatus Methanomassiliicoccus intestinalis]|jgi:hypothetical protein|uniref:Uncharacterized protein n=1 Tax=Candidatus Methanomassiliicoccus intestinalis TaxID=1406512 RepID=A0A8J8PEY8_9ARCH|nr:MAG: hypothetical protein A3207_00855 [Candidatus Methanomassiliicoccus intestinalis]
MLTGHKVRATCAVVFQLANRPSVIHSPVAFDYLEDSLRQTPPEMLVAAAVMIAIFMLTDC